MGTSAKKQGERLSAGPCRQTGHDVGGRRAKSTTPHHQGSLAYPVFLTPKFPWKLWKLILYTQNTHTHFRQQSIHRNESKFKTDKCQIICTFIQASSRKWNFVCMQFLLCLCWQYSLSQSKSQGSPCQDHLHSKIFHVLWHGTPAKHKVD